VEISIKWNCLYYILFPGTNRCQDGTRKNQLLIMFAFACACACVCVCVKNKYFRLTIHWKIKLFTHISLISNVQCTRTFLFPQVSSNSSAGDPVLLLYSLDLHHMQRAAIKIKFLHQFLSSEVHIISYIQKPG
jgi:hypothetical protein